MTKNTLKNIPYGFEQYAEYVKQFDLERTARITGLKPEDIYAATKLYATKRTGIHYRNILFADSPY